MGLKAITLNQVNWVRKMGSEVYLVALRKGSLGNREPVGHKEPVDIDDVQQLFQRRFPFKILRGGSAEGAIATSIFPSLKINQ
jgi:hypothetical protein